MPASWSDFLVSRGAQRDGIEIHFGNPRVEIARAGQGPAIVPLTHLAPLRAQGEEAAPFLHNLFSNDVKTQGVERARWNSFSSPKGRMLASFLVWREGADFILAPAADLQPAFLKKLSMYVLRAKVKITNAAEESVLLGITGAGADKVLAAVGIAHPPTALAIAESGGIHWVGIAEKSWLLSVPTASAPALFDRLVDAGATPAGTGVWQAAMVAAGLPLITLPTQEEFVAQMLNYELIGGVSFTKGCYPGQEIVARTQYLGKLKKRMYRLHLGDGFASPPAPGQDLYAPDFPGQSVGKLVNVVPGPAGGYEALAVLQTSSAEGGDIRLGTPEGPQAALLPLPYALT
ncbi:MAG: folate-binding protein YgfZ [Zoogloeaceae bacterium]|nr:folate-binding protein YgfZ [Zoogloeaceae bacterium]